MITRALRIGGAPLLRPLPRFLSTTSTLRNASPEWESLIGGRAGVERKRQLFEQKYQHVLEKKAKEQGLTVEQLKEKAAGLLKAKEAVKRAENLNKKGPVEAGSVDTRKEGEGEKGNVTKPVPSSQKGPSQAKPAYKKGESPVKVRSFTFSLAQKSSADEMDSLTALTRDHGLVKSTRFELFCTLDPLDDLPSSERVPLSRDPDRDLPEDDLEREEVPSVYSAIAEGRRWRSARWNSNSSSCRNACTRELYLFPVRLPSLTSTRLTKLFKSR